MDNYAEIQFLLYIYMYKFELTRLRIVMYIRQEWPLKT